MIVRIQPLLPPAVSDQQKNPAPRKPQLNGAGGAAGYTMKRSTSSNSMLGFSGSLPLPQPQMRQMPPSLTTTLSQPLQEISVSIGSRKRSKPYSDDGLSLPQSSTTSFTSKLEPFANRRLTIPSPSPAVLLQQIEQRRAHRHSLKLLEHGGNGQFLGDGGFNIRLGQSSSRWSLESSSGAAGTSASKKDGKSGGKPRAARSTRDRDSLASARKIGIRPLPSSPPTDPKRPRPAHWAPSRPVHGTKSVEAADARIQESNKSFVFGGLAAVSACMSQPSGDSSSKKSSGSESESTTKVSPHSAPAWLDDHEEDRANEKLASVSSSTSSSKGASSILITPPEKEPSLSEPDDGDGDGISTDDGGNQDLDISVDSGIDSIENQKKVQKSGDSGRSSSGAAPGNNGQPRGRGRSHRDIYGLNADDENPEADLFPESFFIFQRKRMAKANQKRVDHFSGLPDEMILKVLAWLPKPALGRVAQVSRRFNRVVSDETLWTHIDCQGKNLSQSQLENIMERKPTYWRMAKAGMLSKNPMTLPICPQLLYLDLSMAIITPEILNSVLGSCSNLVKLSMEHLELNAEILETAAATFGHSLDTLNLTMCYFLENEKEKGVVDGNENGSEETKTVRTADAVCNLLQACEGLKSLNMGCVKQNWTEPEIMKLMSSFPKDLEQLNLAGFRNQFTDTHIQVLTNRCPALVELDLSDAQIITMMSIEAVSHLSKLQHLSLSRCYSVEPESYELLQGMPALRFLELFMLFKDESINLLANILPGITLNQFPFSAIARPTIGIRRSSIWEQRVKD